MIVERAWWCGWMLVALGGCSQASAGDDENAGGSTAENVGECTDFGFDKPTGPVPCGSIGCDAGSICVESEGTFINGVDCISHFCATPPAECQPTPTCDCLQGFLDYVNPNPLQCSQTSTGIWLWGHDVRDPPWTTPLCPGLECAEGETCWRCELDGGVRFWEHWSYQCNMEDPTRIAALYCHENLPL